MPNEMLRVADLLHDVLGLTTQEVSAVTNDARLIMLLPAMQSSNGDMHKFIREIGSPNVGFRSEYKGRCFSKSVDETVTVQLQILDFSWAVDKAVADTYPSNRGGAQGLIDREGFRHLREALFVAEKQFLNGVSGAGWTDGTVEGKAAGYANGHIGMADYYNSVANGAIDHGDLTDLTSVYYLRVGEDDVASVYNGDLPFSFGPTVIQHFTEVNSPDGDANGPDGCANYNAYYTPGCTWLSTFLGTSFSAARRANIGPDGTFTDDDIYDDLSTFPAGRKPTHMVCNQRTLNMLRKSRTATNATGAPAPIPLTVGDGTVTVVTTDAIGTGETQVV